MHLVASSHHSHSSVTRLRHYHKANHAPQCVPVGAKQSKRVNQIAAVRKAASVSPAPAEERRDKQRAGLEAAGQIASSS